MIFQLGGLTNLIIGIAAARAGDSVQGENKKGKFNFRYQ